MAMCLLCCLSSLCSSWCVRTGMLCVCSVCRSCSCLVPLSSVFIGVLGLVRSPSPPLWLSVFKHAYPPYAVGRVALPRPSSHWRKPSVLPSEAPPSDFIAFSGKSRLNSFYGTHTSQVQSGRSCCVLRLKPSVPAMIVLAHLIHGTSLASVRPVHTFLSLCMIGLQVVDELGGCVLIKVSDRRDCLGHVPGQVLVNLC